MNEQKPTPWFALYDAAPDLLAALQRIVAVLALSVLTGCDDLESYAADQASLADAIAQAAKEAGR